MSIASSHYRLIVDVSSLSRWHGPAVGISRVDRIFASWARAHQPNALFAFFDPVSQELREVRPEWIDRVLSGDASVDLWGVPDSNPTRKHKSDRIPQAIRPLVLSLLRPKKWAMTALERIRLASDSARLRALATRLQEFLMSEKYRRQMTTAHGSRRALVPFAMFGGSNITLTERDLVLNAGFGWSHINVEAIRYLKQRDGFQFVLLCYDIIPLLFPEFYKPHDVNEFRKYFQTAFPLADLVILTSRRVEIDVKAYCTAHGLSLRATSVCPLGANATRPRSSAPAALPPGIARDRYALFVSTIEPRKGHRLLYRVWKRLLADGVPQAQSFKLVFLGRPGWMVDDLLHDLKADGELGDTLRIISFAEDDALAALYANAAFCLYPSMYEGYGLPIIEAFSYGKSVIASTGGSIPEVVGDFSPCLDPKDEEAWYRLMRNWIEKPSLRTPYETAIRERFRHPSWDEASAKLFAILDEQSHGAR